MLGFKVPSLIAFVVASALTVHVVAQKAVAKTAKPAADDGKPAFTKKPRKSAPRTSLSEPIQSVLPPQGIVVLGSGSDAAAWRVIVTLEGDFRSGSNARPGSSPIELVEKRKRKLDPEVLKEFLALADRAWREKPGKRNTDAPISDYDEMLVIVDGDETFFLDGHGPITSGFAGELVARLKAEAAK